MKTIHLLSAIAVAALLAGCGGGGGDTPAPVAASDAVPDSASTSAEGMTAWLAALSLEDAEAKEPLDASRFNPASAEEAEPLALN
jgi:hypothetical protein